MNWVDIVLIIWLVQSFFSGWRSGFIYKLGSLVGLIIGFWIASRYAPSISEAFGNRLLFSTPTLFFILLTLTTKLFGIGAWFLNKAFNIIAIIPFMKTINNFLGACLSVLISVFIISGVVFMVQFFAQPDSSLAQAIDESQYADRFAALSPVYEPILSDRLESYRDLIDTVSTIEIETTTDSSDD